MAAALEQERWVEREQWVLSEVLTQFAAEGEFDLVREIIDVFVNDSQAKVESLRKAVGAGDLTGARRIGHSLKGASRQMGITRMADEAERLERCPLDVDPANFSSLVLAILESWRQVKQSVIDARDSLPCNQT
jgi:HPt (histidine-containing phosphotransfer) domain-containing protein